MTIIHLLIEDDYIEEFMDTLPKDKITVIESDFEENKVKLQEEFAKYQANSTEFNSYSDSMKELNNWLKEHGE